MTLTHYHQRPRTLGPVAKHAQNKSDAYSVGFLLETSLNSFLGWVRTRFLWCKIEPPGAREPKQKKLKVWTLAESGLPRIPSNISN